MDDILNDPAYVLNGFWVTIQLLVWSGLLSLVVGTVLAAMRVGPISVLQRFGGAYVVVFRNTPLLVVFIFVFNALPTLGIFVTTPFLIKGVAALTLIVKKPLGEQALYYVADAQTGEPIDRANLEFFG